MSQGQKISLVGGSWSIRLRWQWCLCACLAGAIFFVSGCAKVAVPNVEGLTQDDATTAIIGAKLKVGTNTQQTSNTVAAGKVISQDPASGGSVATLQVPSDTLAGCFCWPLQVADYSSGANLNRR
jgi:hypothetical protein